MEWEDGGEGAAVTGPTGWPRWGRHGGKELDSACGEVRGQEDMGSGGRIWGGRQACDPAPGWGHESLKGGVG